MTTSDIVPTPVQAMVLHPRDHIDRQAEQEMFRTLVTYEVPARMLTICDGGGSGKSSLLRRLQYNCQREIKPSIPSCLLAMRDVSSPFEFVSTITRDFKSIGDDVRQLFTRFKLLDTARTSRDFAPFQSYQTPTPTTAQIYGTVRTGNVLGGSVTGVNNNNYIQHADILPATSSAEFTADQDLLARECCIAAFFEDIRTICSSQPLVLLLDGWEHCGPLLQDWIRETLLQNYVFHPDPAGRPDRLTIVIAGRPYDPATQRYGLREDEFGDIFPTHEELEMSVQTIKQLSKWDTPHIQEFMKINGRPEPTELDVAFLREKLEQGMSLEKAATFVQLVTGNS